MTMACGGYGSHRPTGPATSQGFDPSRRDPKKPAFSLYVPAPDTLLSYKFMCKIYIDIKYYKVFILFFHYYIFIIFFYKINDSTKTNDLTRKSWRTGIKNEAREPTWRMRSRERLICERWGRYTGKDNIKQSQKERTWSRATSSSPTTKHA